MALHVCEYPKCKALTLMDLCDVHREETCEDEEDETVEVEPQTSAPAPAPPRVTQDALVASVMRVVENHPALQKKKEPVMPSSRLCIEILNSGKRCRSGGAKGSDYCQRHRDLRDKGQPRDAGIERGLTARKAPEPRPFPSITMAEPVQLNPPSRHVGPHDEPGETGIDDVIGKMEADLAMLRATKLILARYQG